MITWRYDLASTSFYVLFLLNPESWTLDMGRCLAGQSTLSFDLYSLFLFCIASSTCLLISSLCSLACVRLPAGFALVCLKYIAFSLAVLTAVLASLCWCQHFVTTWNTHYTHYTHSSYHAYTAHSLHSLTYSSYHAYSSYHIISHQNQHISVSSFFERNSFIHTYIRVDAQAFAHWKQEVLKKVKYNINRKKHVYKKYRPRFNKQQIMRKLQEIHNDYVVVGADKAENNVIVVCKKYYLSRVIK